MSTERALANIARLRKLHEAAKAPWAYWNHDISPYRITDNTGEHSALLDSSEDCEGFTDARAGIAIVAVNSLPSLLDAAEALVKRSAKGDHNLGCSSILWLGGPKKTCNCGKAEADAVIEKLAKEPA